MDQQTARKMAQRAGLGRFAALVQNEKLANVTFNPLEGCYTMTPLQSDRHESLTFSGRSPYMAEKEEREDGLIVPSAMFETDILPGSYIYKCKDAETGIWKVVNGDVMPEDFVQVIRLWNNWDEKLTAHFAARLRSCFNNLSAIYLRQRPCPSLDSDWITWEQSIVEGTMHPLHQCRMTMDPKGQSQDKFDTSKPQIAFVRVDRSAMTIYGDLDAELQPLLKAAGVDTSAVKPSEMIVPVHEFNIEGLFAQPDAAVHLHELLPQRIQGLAQSSTRSITVPGVPGICVKLSIAMIIGDNDRLVRRGAISAGYTVSTSNIFDPERVQGLQGSHLDLIPEVAGGTGFGDRLGVIIRRENFYDNFAAGVEDDVTCFLSGALQEPAVIGRDETVAEHVFQLTTRRARQDFFRSYLQVYLQTVLPPLLLNGILFYAHGQNMVVKVSKSTKKILGFALRDLGDTGVNVELFESSTGITVSEEMKGTERSTHTVERLLDNAGRIIFATVLLRFGLRLRLDEHDPALATVPAGEEIVHGKDILVQEIDKVLRQYEDESDTSSDTTSSSAADSDAASDASSSSVTKTPKNLVKLARYNWLEKPKWPVQAFISQRMRGDWKGRSRDHAESRVLMQNILYTECIH